MTVLEEEEEEEVDVLGCNGANDRRVGGGGAFVVGAIEGVGDDAGGEARYDDAEVEAGGREPAIELLPRSTDDEDDGVRDGVEERRGTGTGRLTWVVAADENVDVDAGGAVHVGNEDSEGDAKSADSKTLVPIPPPPPGGGLLIGAGLGAGLMSAKMSTWLPLAARPFTRWPFTLPRTRLSKSVTSAAATAPIPELAGPPFPSPPPMPAPLLSSRRFSSARWFMCSCSTRAPRALMTDMNLANCAGMNVTTQSLRLGSRDMKSERRAERT